MENNNSVFDNFFSLGAEEINHQLKKVGCEHEFTFINFRRDMLIWLLPSNLLKYTSRKNIIIIDDHDLMPLALYYLIHNKTFKGLFSAATSVTTIIQTLKTWYDGEFFIRTENPCFENITLNEMAIFDLHTHHSYQDMLDSKLIDMQKYYKYTKTIATKMNKRKFANLFYN